MEQTSFHPGEHIQEELEALSMSPEAFAERLKVPSIRLIAILEGRENVDAEFAMRLAHFFGTTAQFWMNLQSSFDLEQAQRLHGAEIEALPTLQAA
jgi:addiction module HigA family antidote